MVKGIVKKPYWGIKPGETIYIDFSGKFNHAAIGIYNSEMKFIVYIWDKEMLDECVEYKLQ